MRDVCNINKFTLRQSIRIVCHCIKEVSFLHTSTISIDVAFPLFRSFATSRDVVFEVAARVTEIAKQRNDRDT